MILFQNIKQVKLILPIKKIKRKINLIHFWKFQIHSSFVNNVVGKLESMLTGNPPALAAQLVTVLPDLLNLVSSPLIAQAVCDVYLKLRLCVFGSLKDSVMGAFEIESFGILEVFFSCSM